jgi:ComF family protein
MLIARVLSALLGSALSPATCAACDAALKDRALFCVTCASSVVRAPDEPCTGPLPITAFALFGGALAVALKRFKYSDRPDLAGPLGSLAQRAARRRRSRISVDLVIPVPLHPRRLVERGYNQAALLASAVSDDLAVRRDVGALVRRKNTPQQARLDRAERLLNVSDAFHVARAAVIRGRRILLVDDIATSGATLHACATALRAAGATHVEAIVIAQADKVASLPSP